MLYSVAICDLLFKLQELVDVYNDTAANEILQEVEKCKNPSDNKSKSRWEKEFIENIYRKTDLLDLEAYTNISHLYDHRNFSAHPALNDNYELISPSKETTIAHIKNILENILVKPPIFIKKVTDMLLEDLSEKKSIYKGEPEKLREYLCRKYFDRMSVNMKKSTLRSLWKLCFCLPDDEECQRNIVINRTAMEFLFNCTDGILDYMKSDSMFSKTSPADNCVIHLCIFTARFPQIYGILSDDSKLQISALINNNDAMRILSWFTSDNKRIHMQNMIKSQHFGTIGENIIDFVAYEYEQSGDLSFFIDYCIEYYGVSSSFDTANIRFKNAIRPFLSEMTRDQLIRLITVSNDNDQIYNRNASYSTNTEIIAAAHLMLGSDFEYSSYCHFKFDETIIKDTGSNNDDAEELEIEIPF